MPVPAISLVMPTISWDDTFSRCARVALDGLGPSDEIMVVFDGVTPPVPDWLLASQAKVLSTGHRSGPAAARNLAAGAAQNEIIFFVDADVELHADAIDRIRGRFAASPQLAAVFGSYDDRPDAPGIVSRFRNLLHHHTHTSNPGPANTFWSGCGAVRRDAFLDLGGFDASAYQRPCIEDIEFGLRLSDVGGWIELDPAILGTHHKRWTLRLMVVTDIRQRAIPWSRLLLRRHELPPSLNLKPAARVSAGASLLMLLALPGLVLPGHRALSLVVICMALSLFLLLNRQFHALLFRCCGRLHGLVGVALHALYLSYSSLVLIMVALADTANRPLSQPRWLRTSTGLRRALITCGHIFLGLLVIAVISKGLFLGWKLTSGTDIYQRLDEWRLFRDGIYPSGQLATPEQQALPYFRTSVYLPWAMPLFGALFAWGGVIQGKLVIQGLSLLSLGLMASVGWHSLRAWGRSAALIGALAPMAITANSNTLAHGQFSIICMGLITLEWLLLEQGLPLPAGVSWALAMVKPQIAATFALPLLVRGNRQGFALGLTVLAGLSGLALLHTHTHPITFLVSWLAVLPYFIGAANNNLGAGLVSLGQNLANSRSLFYLILAATVCSTTAIMVLARHRRMTREKQLPSHETRNLQTSLIKVGKRQINRAFSCCHRAWKHDPLAMAGLAGVLGEVSFYHLNMDNIMLFPALLASWRLLLKRPRVLEALITILMSASLWTPLRMLEALPASGMAQSLIWVTLGAVLILDLRKGVNATEDLPRLP